jgi:hypothetical protein
MYMYVCACACVYVSNVCVHICHFARARLGGWVGGCIRVCVCMRARVSVCVCVFVFGGGVLERVCP